jgi:hypothetical protein
MNRTAQVSNGFFKGIRGQTFEMNEEVAQTQKAYKIASQRINRPHAVSCAPVSTNQPATKLSDIGKISFGD